MTNNNGFKLRIKNKKYLLGVTHLFILSVKYFIFENNFLIKSCDLNPGELQKWVFYGIFRKKKTQTT